MDEKSPISLNRNTLSKIDRWWTEKIKTETTPSKNNLQIRQPQKRKNRVHTCRGKGNKDEAVHIRAAETPHTRPRQAAPTTHNRPPQKIRDKRRHHINRLHVRQDKGILRQRKQIRPRHIIRRRKRGTWNCRRTQPLQKTSSKTPSSCSTETYSQTSTYTTS